MGCLSYDKNSLDIDRDRMHGVISLPDGMSYDKNSLDIDQDRMSVLIWIKKV